MTNGNDMDRNGHSQLKVLYQYLCGGAQKDHENPSQESQNSVQELNMGGNGKQKCQLLYCCVMYLDG